MRHTCDWGFSLSSNLFKKTSELTEAEIAAIKVLVHDKQPYSNYFNAALNDLNRGLDNRIFHLKGDSGLAMGIDFDGLRIVSVVGEIGNDTIRTIAQDCRRTEFHVGHADADVIETVAGPRVVRRAELKYYALERHEAFELTSLHSIEIRLLNIVDLPFVEKFYAENYESTIFSAWMLEQPFIGLFVDKELASAGGAAVLDTTSGVANIGNFLTLTKFRGRRYAQIVAKSLINDLIKNGFSFFTLGTTEENIAAWRAWEAVGFELLDRRVELELAEGH